MDTAISKMQGSFLAIMLHLDFDIRIGVLVPDGVLGGYHQLIADSAGFCPRTNQLLALRCFEHHSQTYFVEETHLLALIVVRGIDEVPTVLPEGVKELFG